MAALARIRGHTFIDRLGPACCVLDLGANDGRFAQEILAGRTRARVVLVEGDPLLTARLEREFTRDGRVALFRGIVGPRSEPRVSFHLSRVPEGNSVLRRFAETWSEETREIGVEMISLRDLFQRLGRPRFDLVKMDIEGAEWDVIEGLEADDAALIDQLSVEFHDFLAPELRGRTEACIARLESFGFASLCRAGNAVCGSPYFDCLFHRPTS